MKVIEVGTRGFIFEFKDPYLTNVYVIMGEERAYVCDTFCGPDSMREVINWINERGYDSGRIMVFNSHHHYDHIWGNCAFPDAIIFSQHKCKELIEKNGQKDLAEYKDHQRGNVRIVMPSMTFSSEIIFHDDCVRFFHSSGHTIDSASCIDIKDRVLFVADNVESPIPYLYNTDFGIYLETLRKYDEIKWDYLISSHDHMMLDDSLLQKNIKYLDGLLKWEFPVEEFTSEALEIHVMNLIEIASEVNIETDTTIKDHYAEILETAERHSGRIVSRGHLIRLRELLS